MIFLYSLHLWVLYILQGENKCLLLLEVWKTNPMRDPTSTTRSDAPRRWRARGALASSVVAIFNS